MAMNISSVQKSMVAAPSLSQQTQTEKKAVEKEETVIRSKTDWVSQGEKRRQALDEKYRRINEQNKRFKDPDGHIFDKYKNPNSPYFRGDLTEIERNASYSAELSWLHNGKAYCYDMRDSLFDQESPIQGDVEVAERKAYNRQKVNNQFKLLMDKYGINIPDDMKLTFTIDPYRYKLSVKGTDDAELIRSLEEALGSAENASELFIHIIQSRSSDSTQFTNEKYDKYNLVRVMKNATGYHLGDLRAVDGKFVTEDGTDIFDLYKDAIRKNPYVRQEDFAVLTAHYGSALYALAKRGFDSIPDLYLSIRYEDGSLRDM